MESGDEAKKKTDEISKYNEANLNIGRLHNAWVSCALARKNFDVYTWQRELETIWSELYADVMRKTNKSEILKAQQQILFKLKLVNNLKTQPHSIWKHSDTSQSQNNKKSRIYSILSEYHLWLRMIQDQMGKGNIYKEIDEDDFE